MLPPAPWRSSGQLAREGGRFQLGVLILLMRIIPAHGEIESRPHVIVVGVNGMEWDIIRPVLLRGELPNFAGVIQRGVYGKMRTLSAPNCPKVYSSIATSTPPEENGITGFVVAGKTARTDMLKREPVWTILSRHGVTVGMADLRPVKAIGTTERALGRREQSRGKSPFRTIADLCRTPLCGVQSTRPGNPT